jgi:putative DNA primase/helicase
MGRVAGILRKNGASYAHIVAGLESWDRASAEPKYANRSDSAIRYAELAEWAVANVDIRTASLIKAETYSQGYPMTDLGNAERMAELSASDLRCVDGQTWVTWDGRRWSKDGAAALEVAMRNARAIQLEAAATLDDRMRTQLQAWGLRSEGRERLHAVLDLARALPQFFTRSAEFDSQDLELNLDNVTLDLASGTGKPHDPAGFHTKLAPVAFDSRAECPRFLSFLTETFDSDPDLISYVQRLFGYCLTGNTGEQVFFLFHGHGANGKSTLVRVLLDLLGEYGNQLPPETLLKQQSRTQTNDLARLEGVRLAVANELPEGRSLDEALVKQLTGGERMVGRLLYKEFREFEPKCKLIISSNYLPEIVGTDLGIWRRVHLIPFAATVPEARRDAALNAKLRNELPGILNWALDGCLAWQCEGLRPPSVVVSAVERFRHDMDSVGAFIDEMCTLTQRARTPNGALWDAYEEWCEDTGKNSVTKTKFFGELRNRGFEAYRTSHFRGTKGISVDGRMAA